VRQDYANLEIVVADNASTDETTDIVRRFVERDSRVRLERSEVLLPASQNFNRVYRATTGPYFMWAADDDLRDPSYVRRCLKALEASPTAVMACTGLRFIDASGAIVEADYARYDNPDMSSTSTVERVRTLLRRGGWYEVYGLIRRDALEQTHLFQDTYGPDVLLVLELALLGPVLKIPEILFFYRRFANRTERERVDRQGGVADVDALMPARLTYLQESMSETIRQASLAWPLKQRLLAEILWASYGPETPFGRNARRELGARLAAARLDRDVASLAKFGFLRAVEAARQSGPARRVLVGRARRVAGRLRRRVLG